MLLATGARYWFHSTDSPLPKANVRVNDVPIVVEIARSVTAREQGLKHRTDLASGTGMLFVYPEPGILRFWMRDTPVDLDIGFFDLDGRLINIRRMQALDDRTFHESDRPALYALEVPRGWFAEHAISPGAELTLPVQHAPTD